MHLTINDSAYYNEDEHKYEISDSSKQVEASKEPITYTHVRNTSIRIVGVKPSTVGVGIIGRGITQCVISGGISIVKNVVTDVLPDSSKMILKTNTFPRNPSKSQTLMIASQDESTLSSNRIVRTSSDIGKSRIDHGRIGTPITNKNIWSADEKFRVKIKGNKADKLETIVQQSPTKKRNTASPRI